MKNTLAILVAVATAACTTAKELHTPDGKTGYSITCSGTAQSWGDCYQRAGEICGTRGYSVIAGGAEQGSVVSGTQYGLVGGTTINRNMIIQCR